VTTEKAERKRRLKKVEKHISRLQTNPKKEENVEGCSSTIFRHHKLGTTGTSEKKK